MTLTVAIVGVLTLWTPGDGNQPAPSLQTTDAPVVTCESKNLDPKKSANVQFDTKSVEFGPWLRRFVAQMQRNWFVPFEYTDLKGCVIVSFSVFKNGFIDQIVVLNPSSTEVFNNSARRAIAGSNPTEPLPDAYQDESAKFTVTFFYGVGSQILSEQPGKDAH